MPATESARTVDLIQRINAEQLALCDRLEAIADSLPDDVDQTACTKAAQSVTQVLDRAHTIEEEQFFPILEAADVATLDLRPTVERLRVEHRADACFAEELRDVLTSYGQGRPAQSPEATGYMLRGFFESVRRHVAFNRELLSLLTAKNAETARDSLTGRPGLNH